MGLATDITVGLAAGLGADLAAGPYRGPCLGSCRGHGRGLAAGIAVGIASLCRKHCCGMPWVFSSAVGLAVTWHTVAMPRHCQENVK